MGKPNYYKLAPTRLYNLEGGSKVFRTQEKVDKAWEEGWFGPPWLVQNAPLISEMDWDLKKDMIDAVHGDPRYEGLHLSSRKSVEILMGDIVIFEEENSIASTIVSKDDSKGE